jgi:tricorn protease
VSRLKLSPDGKQLGFWVSGSDGGLFVLNLETGEAKKVLHEPGTHWYGLGGGDFAWSPDMRWLCVQRRAPYGAWNLWILPADGSGEPVNITRLNAFHNQPAWSADGKYLYFFSNRAGNALYAIPLTRETARRDDKDIQFEKPKDDQPLEVRIDFEDIDRRIRRWNAQPPQADLTAASDGKIYFISEGDIWQVSYDGSESKRLTTGGGHSALRVSADAKRLYYIRNGELYVMRLDANNRVDKVEFKADYEFDAQAQREAAFVQFWRAYERGFYDPVVSRARLGGDSRAVSPATGRRRRARRVRRRAVDDGRRVGRLAHGGLPALQRDHAQPQHAASGLHHRLHASGRGAEGRRRARRLARIVP